ncbi:MAG: type II toxin-antitoxin system RelE/ParE family toxin [Deltaproteobacteria bacterium]|nr:type II toxin-antitoxin system RelE/ParE family toxin [Deltaproteobacteria bacterium]
MPFEILYHAICLQKDFPKLDRPTLKRIRTTIEDRLMTAPVDFGKPLKYTTENLRSLRVGDWRVIYKITEKQVIVLRIGHRREVYSLIR